MLTDRYGYPISTSSQAARDAYVAGYDGVLMAGPTDKADLRRAIEADPDFALARIALARASFIVADVATAARTVDLPIGSLPNGGGYRLAPDGAHDAGDNRNAHSVIWQWIAPRTQAVVWPPADATHSIVDLPVT